MLLKYVGMGAVRHDQAWPYYLCIKSPHRMRPGTDGFLKLMLSIVNLDSIWQTITSQIKFCIIYYYHVFLFCFYQIFLNLDMSLFPDFCFCNLE